MREPCCCNRNEVFLRKPSIPVLHKHVQCGLVFLHLAEREFINYRIVIRIVKNAWRYPRLASARSSERLDRVKCGVRHTHLKNEPASTGSKSQKVSKCVGSA